MQRNVQIFFRPNPNTDQLLINNLEALETYVRVLSITVLGLEGDPQTRFLCMPGQSEILNPASNRAFSNLDNLRNVLDSVRNVLDLEQNMNIFVLYPRESNV